MAGGRQQIVILGGGVGGVVAATKIGRSLGSKHDVILIDRNADHIFMPAFLSLMVGQCRVVDISRRLKNLERRQVRVLQAEILGLDPLRRQVLLESTAIDYDYLIVAMGLRSVPEVIPGFTEGAHHAWELEAALRFQRSLEFFNGGRILIGMPPGPTRCPPALYEAQWILDSYFRKRGLRDRVDIDFFTPEPEPAGEARASAVWLDTQNKNRKINSHYEFVAQSIDPEDRTVTGLYGYRLCYDLLFLVPPHRPPQALLDSGLAEKGTGIRVDYDTLATKWENIYAIGDCADMPASRAAGVAYQEAHVVAHNLAVEVTGRGEKNALRLHDLNFISTGPGHAAAVGTHYPLGWPPFGSLETRSSAPSRRNHWAKTAFKKWWLWRYF